MTEKQDNILSAALELSEGLIFKHFKNKKGLLDALYLRLQGKLQKELSDIMFETDPKEVLRITIQIEVGIRLFSSRKNATNA